MSSLKDVPSTVYEAVKMIVFVFKMVILSHGRMFVGIVFAELSGKVINAFINMYVNA